MIREQIRECFTLKPAYSQERMYVAQAEDELKFRGLEEGEKVNQSLISKAFVPTDQWRRVVQLIISEAKNE